MGRCPPPCQGLAGAAARSGRPRRRPDASGAASCSAPKTRSWPPIVPSSHSLFGPRGAALTADGAAVGRRHGAPPAARLAGAARRVTTTRPMADRPAALSAARAATPRASAWREPQRADRRLRLRRRRLAVADAWNHRVLIWHRAPRAQPSAGRRGARAGRLHGRLANRGAIGRAPTRCTGPTACSGTARACGSPTPATGACCVWRRPAAAQRRSRPTSCSASPTSSTATRTPAALGAASCAGRTR